MDLKIEPILYSYLKKELGFDNFQVNSYEIISNSLFEIESENIYTAEITTTQVELMSLLAFIYNSIIYKT